MIINKKILNIFFFICSLLLVNSCADQSADTLSGEVKGQREIERLEACSSVNLMNGVFQHYNTHLLFVCTGWDREFPHLYRSIKNVHSASWNHLIGSFDKEFVSNLERRDRFFSSIRHLDKEGGLDDLSKVIVALNETNYFDSVKLMLSCIDDPTNDECEERKERIPTRESLKDIIKLVDINPEAIGVAATSLNNLNGALKEHEKELRDEIQKFKNSPIYLIARLGLIDSFAEKFISGLGDEEKTFISKLLSIVSDNKGTPWLASWAKTISGEKLQYLVSYPINENPNLTREVKALKYYYDSAFSCSFKNNGQSNDLLEFDFNHYLGIYSDLIKSGDVKKFYDFSSSSIVGMKISSEVCETLEKNEFQVSFISMLQKFADLLKEKKYFELVQFAMAHTTAISNPDKKFEENQFLMNILTGKIFESLNVVNKSIFDQTTNFVPTLHHVLLDLPDDIYDDSAILLTEILADRHAHKLKGASEFWNFFNEKEKSFLFNFIDRHFDEETRFTLLFEFYAKLLLELEETQPKFKEYWASDENTLEMTYLSLEDFVNNLAGRETLLDFKKFFSRDHILKLLELLSKGAKINEEARAELAYKKSSEYLIKSQHTNYYFALDENKEAYDANPIIACMKVFTDIEQGLYQLVKNLPKACASVSSSNIAFRSFSWLSIVESKYQKFAKNEGAEVAIFDEYGLLSPHNLNNTFALTKILDEVVGDINSQLPTKAGIDYLLTSTNEHLQKEGLIELLDEGVFFTSELFDSRPEENRILRNSLIKKFIKEENFNYSSSFFRNIATLFNSYGRWVTDDRIKIINAQKAKSRAFKKEFSCESVSNQVINENACPSKDVVKKHAGNIASFISTTWETSQKSGIHHLIDSVSPAKGILIPLASKKQTREFVTLGETFKYLYDTSDSNFSINKQRMNFVNKKWKTSTEVVTTLERVETVIREVYFKHNYLGTAFLNAVVSASDYNKEVDRRKGLMEKCLKIPKVRCLKAMTDDELRMGNNALRAFDSLLDVNNGRGLDKRLNYGTYLKTFEQVLVQSSPKKAQEVQLKPLDDELLKQHNGRVLGEMTHVNMWSNGARAIRDRVGRTREEFEKFVNSEEMKRVDAAMFRGFNLPLAGDSAQRLIKKLNTKSMHTNTSPLDDTIDWIASLSYEETRILEEVVARLMLVGSYLGHSDLVFGREVPSIENQDEDQNEGEEVSFSQKKYASNNFFQVFLALEQFADRYQVLKKHFPNSFELKKILNPVNNFLTFFTDELSRPEERNVAYIVLNDTFLILESLLFDNHTESSLAEFDDASVNGLDSLMVFVDQEKSLGKLYRFVPTVYAYIESLHVKSKKWFETVALNTERVILDKRINLTFMQEYMRFTTQKQTCSNTKCRDNLHYDEIGNLVRFAAKSEAGHSNLKHAYKEVFVENFDQLNEMINDVLPALKIKAISPLVY